jgi:hypothetical protein
MRRVVSLVAIVAALSGCGSDSTGPTTASFAGTWNLTSVNNLALPYTIPSSVPMTEVLSDQFVMTATGTFTETFNLRFTDTGGVVTTKSFTDAGTYTLIGTAASFKFNSDQSVTPGSVNGNTFTISGGANNAITFLYTKQ